jgi:hypothetical protein
MKLMTLMATVAAIFIVSQPAQAREHRGHHYTHSSIWRHVARQRVVQPQDEPAAWESFTYSAPAAYRGGMGGRPAAWCGWEMRQLVSSDPGPQYNLARNWARWGEAGPAGVGAVVVWPHHVGKIVGREGDQWLVESGNDGHAVRTRVRSIAGAIAVRWG